MISPRMVGPTNRSVCSAVPWAMIVGRAQAATARPGRLRPASAQAWSMTSCSTAPASRPQGDGQWGARRPWSASARWRSVGSSTATMVPTRASSSARSAIGLGRQVDRQPPAPSGQGQPGRLGPQRGGAAHQLAQGGGPAEVDVGVVLPGEAHPPEDLDGALGRLDVAVEGQGGGELHGEAALIGLLARGRAPLRLEDHGGVPRGRHALLDGHQHVGQPVLHPLELADRSAELLPGAGVLGRHVQAPAGPADRLGRQDDEGEVPHGAGRGVEHPLGGDRRPVEGPRCRRPGQVEARQLAHLGGVGPLEDDPAVPVGGRHRGEHVGDDGAVHQGPEHAGHDQRAVGSGHAGEPGVGDRRSVGCGRGHGQRRGQAAVGQAGEEGLDQTGRATGGHHAGHHRGGVPGPDRRGPAQLLGHHGELDHAGALAAQFLVEVDGQQPLRGQVPPVGREGVRPGVEGVAHDGGHPPGLGPAPDRGAQLLVLVLDADGHRIRPRRGAARGRPTTRPTSGSRVPRRRPGSSSGSAPARPSR